MGAPQTQLPFDTPARTPNASGVTTGLRTDEWAPVNIAAFALRLEAVAPTTGVTMPTLHAPMPPTELLDDERLGEPGVAPDEERVRSYVEYRARQLFELTRDAMLLGQTLRLIGRPDASYDTGPTIAALQEIHLATNRRYSNLLCEYAELLGEDAADDLADWLDQLIERIDTPRPPEHRPPGLRVRPPEAGGLS